MTEGKAQTIVVTSALVVFGVYFYRHLTEGTGQPTVSGTDTCPLSGILPSGTKATNAAQQLIGFGTPAQVGKFITAWGFTFFVIAIIATASPGLGASIAILVATSDFLANSCQVAHDVETKIGSQSNPQVGTQVGDMVPANLNPFTHPTLSQTPPASSGISSNPINLGG